MKRNEMKSTPGRNHFLIHFVVQKKIQKIHIAFWIQSVSNGMRAIFFFSWEIDVLWKEMLFWMHSKKCWISFRRKAKHLDERHLEEWNLIKRYLKEIFDGNIRRKQSKETFEGKIHLEERILRRKKAYFYIKKLLPCKITYPKPERNLFSHSNHHEFNRFVDAFVDHMSMRSCYISAFLLSIVCPNDEIWP